MTQSDKIKQLPTTANIVNLSLSELAEAANREAQSGDDAFVRGLQHYKACGEYLLAAKAKGKAEIGSSFRWSQWLKENWKRSERTARRCMQIAEDWEKMVTHDHFSDDMGMNAAIKLISVQPETIDVEVFEKEVIKEKKIVERVEIEKPDMVSKDEFNKVKKESERLQQQLEKIQNQFAKLAINK